MIFVVMASVTIWTLSAYKSFKAGYRCLGIYLVTWVFIWYYIYWVRVARSCEHLYDSIHPDVKYSEAGGECRWVKGQVCWDYTIEGGFKPLFWGKDKCEDVVDDFTQHKRM
jgi:hypothetical protein